jgi:two-component system, chemotaxis family, CheB/CheR fusion protein
MTDSGTDRAQKSNSEANVLEEGLRQQSSQSQHLLPIVGVGASAGGLAAFKQLLRQLSIDTGMAFVLIQHLDPEHKSLLTEILAHTTKMPVCEVTDGIEVESNHVYIIPPNTKMILVGRILQLSPRERIRGGYLPIDLFFESIATQCGSQGIGVYYLGQMATVHWD